MLRIVKGDGLTCACENFGLTLRRTRFGKGELDRIGSFGEEDGKESLKLLPRPLPAGSSPCGLRRLGGLHRRRARDKSTVAPAARGRPAPVLLPLHVAGARGHRPRDPPDHTGALGADLGEHVEPRRPDVPVHVDVPELEAAQTGATAVVALRNPGAELLVLRVLFRELRLRVLQRQPTGEVLDP